MPDPYMVLYDSSGPVAVNDDWESEFTFKMLEAFKQVGASQLDEESKDAAMVRELQPGQHTVIVNDFNYTSGIVLIEIFELP
jgi:ABC-type Fe3+ transport system substrate-binding protein